MRESGGLFNNKGLSKTKEFSACKGMKLRKRKIKLATIKFHCAPQARNCAVVGVPRASQASGDSPDHTAV